MENNTKEIRHELLKLCWYMRGGVTYAEAASMSPQDREMVAKLVCLLYTSDAADEP